MKIKWRTVKGVRKCSIY